MTTDRKKEPRDLLETKSQNGGELDDDDEDDDGKLDNADSTSTGELADFADCMMLVMMMGVDSAAAGQSGSNCGLLDVAREVAMSIAGEFIVVEEAVSSVVVLIKPNSSPSTESHVVQLVTFASKVIGLVSLEFSVKVNF